MKSRARQTTDIWPGFVDALATLLILIIFVLMIFVLGQFFLAHALSGRDAALEILSKQVSELGEMLSLEQTKTEKLVLDIENLSLELNKSNNEIVFLNQENNNLRDVVNDLGNKLTNNNQVINQLETQISFYQW